MKPKLRIRSFIVLIAVCTTILIPTSCGKFDHDALEGVSKKVNDFELAAVRSNYDKLIEIDVASKTKKDKREKSKKKRLNWDNAYTFKIEGEDKLIVPFALEEDFYYKNPDSTVASFSENTFFVVTKHGKDYDYEVVTRYPDMKWLNRRERGTYSGTVIVEDVNGNFLKGYKYDEGKVTHEVFKQSEGGRTSWMDCYQITYYSCAYVPEIGWYADCQWMYNDFQCFEVSHGGGGSGSAGGSYAMISNGGYNYGNGGGSGPNYRPYIGEYPDYISDIVKNRFQIALNSAQKFLVNEIIFFFLKNCFNNVIWANVCASGLKVEFKMDPAMDAAGAFNPVTNEFKFKEDDAIKANTFTEEFFHAYQKTYYPGGTAQYVQAGGPNGRINMEFEAWLMRDIQGLVSTANSPSSTGCCFATDDPGYFPWLTTITNNGTKWPSWSDMQSQYYNYMKKFGQKYPSYNAPINYDLKPDAYLSALSNSPCPK